MNKHILLDRITASIGALFSGKKKFFSESIESPSFEEQVSAIKLKFPQLSGKGDYKVQTETLVGRMDAAFRIAQRKGPKFPTIIYHHGNNERPFNFSRFSKNTFYNIFIASKNNADANLIVVRAPFHDCSLKYYQKKMLEIKTIERGHVTGALNTNELKSHILSVLSMVDN